MGNSSFPAMPPMGMPGTVKTENYSVPDRMVGLGTIARKLVFVFLGFPSSLHI